MSTRQYQIVTCPFVGESLDNEMEDDVEFYDDEYEDLNYTHLDVVTRRLCGEKHLKDNIVYHGGQTYIFPKWSKLLSQHLVWNIKILE